jgi:hypothetical protein
MKAVRMVAAVAVSGGLLASGSLALAAGPRAHAAATPQGGAIHILISHFGSTTAKITITGAIGDYGTITTETKTGKPSSNGDYGTIKLRHGTLFINATAFNAKLDKAPSTVNKSNCSYYVSGSGGSTIESGTGAYAGAHGAATLTATFAGVAPKKANGTCNFANNAPTLGSYEAITGNGTVHFG